MSIPIEPNDALCQIMEYSVVNCMNTLIITSTLSQRLQHLGDIEVTPITKNEPPLVLINVMLPNWVISKTRSIIKYNVDVFRHNHT